MNLKSFLDTLPRVERSAFAERCGTSIGHLKNVAYGYKPCSPELAIEIERESGGKSPCEVNCPGVDWAYIRNSRPRRAVAARV